MGKLIMWNLITLDGYFEGAQGWDLGFHGLVWGPELEAFSQEQLNTAGRLIFGRTTYTGMAEYWTTAEDDPVTTQFMNELPKVVCSTTLNEAKWSNTTIVRDAVKEIGQMKEEVEGNLFVFGSGELSQSLMKAGLFDEYRLCVVPVFLGKGKRLFPEGLPYEKLELTELKRLETGGVILRYAAKAD